MVNIIRNTNEKIQNFMSEIDENDALEETSRKSTKEEINQKIKRLKDRKALYECYQQKMKKEDINEISIVDPDTRLVAVNNNGVDICYNVQTVVDGEHCLIVDCNVINNPTDHGQLSEMCKRAKDIFEGAEFKALADKGYYNADDLKECEKEGIITYVSKQVFSNATGEREFYPDRFEYDKEKNVYRCPAGQEF